MTRGIRATLVVGAVLMAAGCAMPWGRLWTLASGETVSYGGFGHGAQVVLPLAVLIAVAALAEWRWVAIGVAGAALAYVAYAGWILPLDLHDSAAALDSGIYAAMGDGPWRAETGIGWAFALLGALVACAGAIWLVVLWAREARPRVTMFADRA